MRALVAVMKWALNRGTDAALAGIKNDIRVAKSRPTALNRSW
jgi:hypothetical protein